MTSDDQTEISISADDIRSFDFENILSRPADPNFERLKSRTCFNYERHFTEEAKNAAEAHDETRQAICEMFGYLCSLHMNLDGTVAFSVDLSEPYRQLLLEVVNDIEDTELQARVADVLWVLRAGNFQVAELAVDAYLESASRLEDPRHWVDGAYRIERALQVGLQLGRNGRKYPKVIQHIEQVLQRLNGEDPMWFSHKMMELLLANREGEPNTYIPLAQKLAETSENEHDWRRARCYWDIQASWYKRQEAEEEAHNSKLRAAETYVKHANDHINQNKPAYRPAVYELRIAIEAYRQLRASREHIQQLHTRMLQYQEKDDDFEHFSFSANISQLVEESRNAVKGKEFRECVFIVASMAQSQSIDYLRDFSLELHRRYPLRFWISSQQLNERGRVTAQRPGISLNDETANENSVRATMYEEATRHHDLVGQGYILPALQQINIEHYIRPDDLHEFVINNPFVPPGREPFFLRGLYAGFKLDFMLATHILIPQIENSIRFLLEQGGVITSHLDPQGIQDEYNLGNLLWMEEVETIFGKDLLFDLQGLLAHRFGSNLRNYLAHGMLNAGATESTRAIYAWGLVLRLCCHPTMVKEVAKREQENIMEAEDTNRDDTDNPEMDGDISDESN